MLVHRIALLLGCVALANCWEEGVSKAEKALSTVCANSEEDLRRHVTIGTLVGPDGNNLDESSDVHLLRSALYLKLQKLQKLEDEEFAPFPDTGCDGVPTPAEMRHRDAKYKLFKGMDKDDDGNISQEEGLFGAGVMAQGLPDSPVQIFQQYDTNGDGFLDVKEGGIFVEAIHSKMSANKDEL